MRLSEDTGNGQHFLLTRDFYVHVDLDLDSLDHLIIISTNAFFADL